MLKTYTAFLMILAVAMVMAKQQLEDETIIKTDDVSSGSGCSESPYISKIAPSSDHGDNSPEPLNVEELSTYVQQLNDAGVRTTGNLKTLSYTEISRLLALWQLSHQRNYYDMNEEKHSKSGAIETAVAPPPLTPSSKPQPQMSASIDEEVTADETIVKDQHKKRVTRV